jgi:hypothetical protein
VWGKYVKETLGGQKVDQMDVGQIITLNTGASQFALKYL